MIPTMLTINEAATKFNLAKHFVRQAVLQGQIPHVKAGKKFLINENHFIDYLSGGRTAGTKEA